MILTDLQKQMIEGKVCPYCKQPSNLVDSSVVYGISYGLVYLCQPCNAWVGVHKGTENAKGRLASKELRLVKIEAHMFFDIIWRNKLLTREECYQWLSGELNLPAEYTHIAMFNLETCKKTVQLCKKRLNDNRRCDLDFGVEPITPYYDLDN